VLKGANMGEFKFAPASKSEQTVFGAERPGYASLSVGGCQVQEWIAFMKNHGIRRVCCLLSEEQLGYYKQDLLEVYRGEFGKGNVCWAPVEDYYLAEKDILAETILPFLVQSDEKSEPVVVHCAGGIGRTGHVLAAWLALARKFSIRDALSAVKEMGRNPLEAVEAGNATIDELYALLRE
jgi:protein-tyrosine phosphatase